MTTDDNLYLFPVFSYLVFRGLDGYFKYWIDLGPDWNSEGSVSENLLNSLGFPIVHRGMVSDIDSYNKLENAVKRANIEGCFDSSFLEAD